MANIYDEMIDTYNRSIEETNSRIGQQEAEKQQLINDYNQQYQQNLQEYQNLQEQNKANIDSWAETQRELQQKQTDYEVGLINQNKAEAEKQTKTEQANAYIDYQKGLNEFGGSSEQLAAAGLQGTGFAKNQDIAMNITYQNRVASANAALQKANTDYDNQIQQALLSNDANLAQLAYQQMTQQYQLALSGFEYRTSAWNNKLNYETQTNNTYYNRINDLNTRIKNYQDSIASAKEAKLKQENYEKELALQQASASRSYYSGGSSSSSGSSGYTNSVQQINTNYYSGAINPDTQYGTFATTDKNGVRYQPNNVGGSKLSSTGKKVSQVFGSNNYGNTGALLDNQTLWTTNGRYYIWDGSINRYVDVTSQYNSRNSGSSGGRSF